MALIPERKVGFGTRQDRKLFPLNFAPDRMGHHMSGLESSVGPALYNNHKVGTIVHEMEKKPESNLGYCARTAERFVAITSDTPSPQRYQQDQSWTPKPEGKTPFNSTAARFFKVPSTGDETPSPYAYSPQDITNKKVSWPMCFGRPDWSRVPQLEKVSVKGKLEHEREFLRQRRRLAYLSLYY